MTRLLWISLLIVVVTGCNQGGSAPTSSIPAGTTVFTVTAGNAPVSFTINGSENPSLTLQRGKSYTFNVNSPEHPFYLMVKQDTNAANAYSNGVTGNGTEAGTLTFAVPAGAPDTLYFDCGVHPAMTGTITITN
jgi:hypothetical protein